MNDIDIHNHNLNNIILFAQKTSLNLIHKVIIIQELILLNVISFFFLDYILLISYKELLWCLIPKVNRISVFGSPPSITLSSNLLLYRSEKVLSNLEVVFWKIFHKDWYQCSSNQFPCSKFHFSCSMLYFLFWRHIKVVNKDENIHNHFSIYH